MAEFRTPKNGPTVLAIRMRRLGDVLATLSALQAVKKTIKAGRVAFLVDTHYHELLGDLDYIDILLPEPPAINGSKGLLQFSYYIEYLRSLRTGKTLDFHSNPRSALITALSGARTRVGFDVRFRKWVYTDVEPRAVYKNGRIVPRTSQESALALARRIGASGPVPEQLPEIQPGEQAIRKGRDALLSVGIDGASIETQRVVGLNPGLDSSKSWPDSFFIDIAERLTGKGKQVVLMWGPGERERVQSIQRRCREKTFLAPTLSLVELPGLLKNLTFLVTIDSGLKHLAACTRLATMTIFGPTSPSEWHMGGDLDMYIYKDLSCSPCRLLECPFGAPCMMEITPDEVMDRIEALEERIVSRGRTGLLEI